MHSSRMRTGRSLTVFRSLQPGGGTCLGGYLPGGEGGGTCPGGYLPGGVPAQGGWYLPGGGTCPGGVVPAGGGYLPGGVYLIRYSPPPVKE